MRADGEWSKVDDGSLGGPGDQQIDAIVADDTGLAAVGWNPREATSTPRSGRRRRIELGSRRGIGRARRRGRSADVLRDIRRRDVLRGRLSTRDGRDPDGAIWLSADGIVWERASVKAVAGAGDQRVSSLVSFASNRLLAAGSQDLGGDEQAAAWVAKLTRASP